MRPLIPSGGEVIIAPVFPEHIEVDDIVLVRVAGHVYLHKVLASSPNGGRGSGTTGVASTAGPASIASSASASPSTADIALGSTARPRRRVVRSRPDGGRASPARSATPFATPIGQITWTGTDSADGGTACDLRKRAGADSPEWPARTFKVATRVRIPLGVPTRAQVRDPLLLLARRSGAALLHGIRGSLVSRWSPGDPGALQSLQSKPRRGGWAEANDGLSRHRN